MVKSWVDAAHDTQTDFPLENLPFGVFRRRDGLACIGVAIGDQILDLNVCACKGLLGGLPQAVQSACEMDSLNALMSLEREASSSLRARIAECLSKDELRPQVEPLLIAQAGTEMLLPAKIGDYTDFYASIYHATNVGKLLRPDNPLLPNYKYIPVGYHGRASSIVVSGTEVRRPSGQTKAADVAAPSFGPTRMLDYELEVGWFVGSGNALGEPVPVAIAERHLFGMCLLNDWSARDVQSWEYQPLGPFLAKNFATTISPWVVTMEALEPFRVPASVRPAGDPEPLTYLDSAENREHGGIDVQLEVWFSTEKMRREGLSSVQLSQSHLKDLYWTPAQMLAHHTSNGCNLQPGDLLGSGTVSGPARDSLGCLLEITRRGAEPLHLLNGEVRSFLEDGDEVVLRGHCERDGFARIGFGECRGVVVGGKS